MFLKKNKIEEIDYHDIDLDNIQSTLLLLWMEMDVGQRKEKCHELMDSRRNKNNS